MDQEEKEKIRAKRLKKMEALSAASASSSTGETTPSQSVSSRPILGSDPNKNTSFATGNAGSLEMPKVSIESTISSQTTVASPISTSTPSKAPRPALKTISFEEWQDKTISEVLRCTVTQPDSNGLVLYLDNLASELKVEGQSMLTIEHQDSIYMEAFQSPTLKDPFNFIFSAWLRAGRRYQTISSSQSNNPKRDVLDQLQATAISYAIMALTQPNCGFFGMEYDPIKTFGVLLLASESKLMSSGFFKELTNKTEEDPDLSNSLVSALRAATVGSTTTTQPAQILSWAVQYPVLFQAMIEWTAPPCVVNPLQPNKEHPLEADSFLGPFFSASPLHSSHVTRYFDPLRMSRGAIDAGSTTIQLELGMIWNTLFQSVGLFARVSETRSWILGWLADVVNQNHKRTAIQAASNSICSDGFMINVTVMLDRLCQPFTMYDYGHEKAFPKIDSAEVSYFHQSPKVNIDKETKLGIDDEGALEFYSTPVPGKSKAISDMFFIAIGLHHYGLNSCLTRCENYERMIKNWDSGIKELQERLKENLPAAATVQIQRAISKYQERKHFYACLRNGIFAALGDRTLQEGAIRVTTFQMAWLLRLVDKSHQYPDRCMELPLPKEAPIDFKVLPEYMIESVISHLKFILSSLPHLIPAPTKSTIVTFCVTFLLQSHYITNPYLTSGLVTVLRYGLPYSNQPGPLDTDLKGGSILASKHLMHALINMFIRVEHTDSSNQFYDKFSIRYEVFEVIDKLWDFQVYRDNLVEEYNKDMDLFIRFVHYLLNDATYLMDEAQAAFVIIHQVQDELDEMQDRDPEDSVRKEKESALEAAQKKAKSYMPLTNKEIMMLRRFTESLADAFAHDDIVQRLANMLNANLELMVGPKQLQLKVKDPDKYSFRPKQLLQDLMSVYLNLRNKKSFIKAVVQDGRSYKPQILHKAKYIATRRDLWDPPAMEKEWERMCVEIFLAKEIEDNLEKIMEGVDIPDEYLDPLMFTLMDDPVVLPSTKVRIDLQTIRSHLLSNPNDPFNRNPLDIKDIKPDVELKAAIEKFKADRLQEYLAKQAAAAAAAVDAGGDDGNDDSMDTSI